MGKCHTGGGVGAVYQGGEECQPERQGRNSPLTQCKGRHRGPDATSSLVDLGQEIYGEGEAGSQSCVPGEAQEGLPPLSSQNTLCFYIVLCLNLNILKITNVRKWKPAKGFHS